MLTSLFRRSTPFNYTLVIMATLSFFVIQLLALPDEHTPEIWQAMMAGAILFGSMFVVNFIVKKNGLSRDSGFILFFFLMLLLFFGNAMADLKLLLANFFILLAMRRLVSLTSRKSTREKIFDASLWIFIAATFQFWAISYILLVFISIIFHVSGDYRNWVLPFIAFFGTAAIFGLYCFAIDPTALEGLRAQAAIDTSIDYFVDQKQNIVLSAYAAIALFFVLSMVITLSSRPLQLQSSYKKAIAWFFTGVFVFVISPAKSNELLVFTVAPLALMATAFVEHYFQNTLKAELALWLTALCAIGLFVFQL